MTKDNLELAVGYNIKLALTVQRRGDKKRLILAEEEVRERLRRPQLLHLADQPLMRRRRPIEVVGGRALTRGGSRGSRQQLGTTILPSIHMHYQHIQYSLLIKSDTYFILWFF